MTRAEAQQQAKAWLGTKVLGQVPLDCMLVEGLVKLTESTPQEMPRFIAPLIERGIKFEVRTVKESLRWVRLGIFCEPEFQQEYERRLMEVDRGPMRGWMRRRLQAIADVFPIVPGVASTDYIPEPKKVTQSQNTRGRINRQAGERYRARKSVKPE